MKPRVISGTAKGRRLNDVPGDTTRPVTDMVKQAVFNIIGLDVVDSSWWDLFGGTGAVGIEALSRGAAFVRFTEIDRKAIEVIRINLEITGLVDRAHVIRDDAFEALNRKPDRDFDYIYVAPPQYKGLWIKSLIKIAQNIDWTHNDSWLIVQIHPREMDEIGLLHFNLIDERKYGSTLLLFYNKKM
jgi:16S rRNA (guanine(966)-N(2))-methyltransferase RsmD